MQQVEQAGRSRRSVARREIVEVRAVAIVVMHEVTVADGVRDVHQVRRRIFRGIEKPLVTSGFDTASP